MTYRYIKNLRSSEAKKSSDLSGLPKPKQKHKSKAAYRSWCSDASTDHVFYSTVEGDAPSKRVTNENPPAAIYGVVADYDAPVDWDTIDNAIKMKCGDKMPTWRSKTYSGYVRLVWEFEDRLPITMEMFEIFMKHLKDSLKVDRVFAGFDTTSLKPNQYFELGEDWVKIGGKVPSAVYQTALMKAAKEKPPQTSETSIPMDVLESEIQKRFPNRWVGEFDIGSRGPLFWIDDGIDREGCQIVEDGVVCYSDRAGKGFVSWREILGAKFVQDYEQKKLGNLLDQYWFNGKCHYKLLHSTAVDIPKDQLILELRQFGFNPKPKKGQPLSELEAAILVINNQNRIDEIAPVVFSNDRVVTYNSHRILNNANINPIEPADNGDVANWPFINQWLGQLFHNSGSRPTVEYLYAWLKRFYSAVLNRQFVQGQAMLLVGPTNKGKSLLSNRVISQLVGGYADASDYLSGQTRFNKDLARVAAWVIDDTTSAASFQDQRKATELIKRAVANPRIEYHAKYVDAISVPWTGRVIFSLNMDANSLSVIPSLDSSNRDKLMALRISNKATSSFPPNAQLEQIIASELPYFAKWLLDWDVPAEIDDASRFGVKSYIDETIASAAYDNSSRSSVAELVEFFVKRLRDYNKDLTHWTGTLTEFQVALHDLNNGRAVGMSGNLEFVRRGMATMEEAFRSNTHVRPVRSFGQGGGKMWEVNLDPKYDISRSQDSFGDPPSS
jgi:hypothetical protein